MTHSPAPPRVSLHARPLWRVRLALGITRWLICAAVVIAVLAAIRSALAPAATASGRDHLGSAGAMVSPGLGGANPDWAADAAGWWAPGRLRGVGSDRGAASVTQARLP